LQRDGAERDEACGLVVDTGRNRHGKVLRDGIEFGVIGEAGARACDMVTDGNTADFASDLEHLTCEAVAQWDRRIEPGKYLFHGRPEPVAPDVANDAPNKIRPCHRLTHKRCFGEIQKLLLPALMSEILVATRTVPGPTRGAGTSATLSIPVR
jgi:hypothetical protein